MGQETAEIWTAQALLQSGRFLRPRLLGSAAAYNDKGIVWSGHDDNQIMAMREGFQCEQVRLAQTIGTDDLGHELATAIHNGAAARDGHGDYATMAKRMLDPALVP